MASKRVPVPPARPAPTPAAAAPPTARVPRPVPRRPLSKDSSLRVLISGASGMIGVELQRRLADAGHAVQKLVRRPPRAENEFSWAPDAKILDFRLLENVDAVINLSGASLNHVPWTTRYKAQILRSRVRSTEALVEAMQMTSSPPPVFLSASAVGYYGDRPGLALTEESPRGQGFLADVVEAWEAAARLAPQRTRTVLLRTGVVLGEGDGALKPLRLATSVGLGAGVGSGRQHWAWISLHDEVGAIVHLLTSGLEGPVNLVGPVPATADDITRRLARDLHRPHALRLPGRVVELGMGDLGRELLLPSQKVVPERLEADGFVWRHRTSDEAIDAVTAPGRG
ncbi:TIGR01777 family oxidoreductase [Amnibacterium sp. CER49]|uniref:TIGR01777 family oxidoreductase n=1 Tax=Amnibacterium sp. CER49 TaxID=3039161 RepID=UPI00244B7589|nr:TIGR01777 family oxidoreductase [Amnibacterium sp. CER49]MDH2445008.1 TIGR01777 family oxidoreductase [Amnibacterium sp. CER49]